MNEILLWPEVRRVTSQGSEKVEGTEAARRKSCSSSGWMKTHWRRPRLRQEVHRWRTRRVSITVKKIAAHSASGVTCSQNSQLVSACEWGLGQKVVFHNRCAVAAVRRIGKRWRHCKKEPRSRDRAILTRLQETFSTVRRCPPLAPPAYPHRAFQNDFMNEATLAPFRTRFFRWSSQTTAAGSRTSRDTHT